MVTKYASPKIMVWPGVRTYAPFERGWLQTETKVECYTVKGVRTYAPFERGWLLNIVYEMNHLRPLSGLTPRLRGDGYTEQPFLESPQPEGQDLRPV